MNLEHDWTLVVLKVRFLNNLENSQWAAHELVWPLYAGLKLMVSMRYAQKPAYHRRFK